MKIEKLLFTLFVLVCVGRPAQAQQDYWRYHQSILNIESLIVDENRDQALTQYDSLFAQYDFVFCKDYVVALQIALLHGDQSRTERYALSALEAGAKIDALERLPLVKGQLSSALWQKIRSKAPDARKRYHQKINLALNKKLTSNFRYDEEHKSDKQRAAGVFQQNFDFIRSIIDSIGFPGEKLVGIDNSDWDKVGQNTVARLYDTQYDNAKVIVSMLHYNRSIEVLGLETFQKAIQTGLLHPYEFACIYTFEVDLEIKMGRKKTQDIHLDRWFFEFPFGLKAPSADWVVEHRKRWGIRSPQDAIRLQEICQKRQIIIDLGYKS